MKMQLEAEKELAAPKATAVTATSQEEFAGDVVATPEAPSELGTESNKDGGKDIDSDVKAKTFESLAKENAKIKQAQADIAAEEAEAAAELAAEAEAEAEVVKVAGSSVTAVEVEAVSEEENAHLRAAAELRDLREALSNAESTVEWQSRRLEKEVKENEAHQQRHQRACEERQKLQDELAALKARYCQIELLHPDAVQTMEVREPFVPKPL